jgi:hypothetical protein
LEAFSKQVKLKFGSGLPDVSFVTCISDWQTYKHCVAASIGQMGSPGLIFERVPIDNSANRFSASQALNMGLAKSNGKLIVFCHQDVVFPLGWLSKLFEQIREVEHQVASWGVIGVAGRCVDGSRPGHVIDPRGELFHTPLPMQVQTLDELCIIIRKNSGLHFDEYFDHFHLYGTDLCLTANSKGMPCFAVDCCLEHLSGGSKCKNWMIQKEKLIEKWWPNRRIVGKKIYTTSGTIRLHSPLVRVIRRMRNLLLDKI